MSSKKTVNIYIFKTVKHWHRIKQIQCLFFHNVAIWTESVWHFSLRAHQIQHHENMQHSTGTHPHVMYQKSLPEGNVAAKRHHTFSEQVRAHQNLCTSKNHNNDLRERGKEDSNTQVYTDSRMNPHKAFTPSVLGSLFTKRCRGLLVSSTVWSTWLRPAVSCPAVDSLHSIVRRLSSCSFPLEKTEMKQTTAKSAPPFQQKRQMMSEASHDVATTGLVFPLSHRFSLTAQKGNVVGGQRKWKCERSAYFFIGGGASAWRVHR